MEIGIFSVVLAFITVGSMAVDVLILDKDKKNKKGDEKCQKKD